MPESDASGTHPASLRKWRRSMSVSFSALLQLVRGVEHDLPDDGEWFARGINLPLRRVGEQQPTRRLCALVHRTLKRSEPGVAVEMHTLQSTVHRSHELDLA